MDIKTFLKYEVNSLNESLDLVLIILERVEKGKSFQKDHLGMSKFGIYFPN